MRVQLWGANYDPEPQGIGPVSTVLAQLLIERGWDVDVVAAHPYYPEPVWGRRFRPYREVRDGVRLVRLPIWTGRTSAAERIRQEASFAVSVLLSAPFVNRALGAPDVMLVASPSFPALLPAVMNARMRRLPMVLWLHDILPDGATASGILDEGGSLLRASRWLERTAYETADEVVVLSGPFERNLAAKGVPGEKISLIYDPATRNFPEDPEAARSEVPTILSMGNIGETQGLAPLVRAFEADPAMEDLGVRLRITGKGVAAGAVAAESRTGRVTMLGVVTDSELEEELRTANLALVTQSYEGTEFNLPSKLMNFMAYGMPVIAAVNPAGEVSRIVEASRGGWVVDSSDPALLPAAIASALADPAEMRRRGRAARRYARERFSKEAFGDAFDAVLRTHIG